MWKWILGWLVSGVLFHAVVLYPLFEASQRADGWKDEYVEDNVRDRERK